ncbi:hypothetical protein B0H19DRAFT_1104197 [Mycena capillaripes]|nr:hypothetical protein B0H19DRAFT_1104197 [Mycena capillaripes]
MSTNPLPFPCGTCARRFGTIENLRQHIQASHSPSSPPPKQPIFQCGTPGCTRKFGKVEDLRQHTKDIHSPSIPPPKQPVFKCGAKGCEAAPFSELLLLHQHTAQAHPKSKKNIPSGSSTSAFSTPGPPIAVTNPQSIQATVLRPQQVSPQVGCLASPPALLNMHPYMSVYSRQCKLSYFSGKVIIIFHSTVASASTSLAAKNDLSNSAHALLARPTHERLMQRLMQLQLRQVLIDKSTLKVGMHFVELAEAIIRTSTNDRRISFLDYLQQRVEWMSQHNDVCSLAYSAKFRADIEKLLQDFGCDDELIMKKAFSEDDQVILHLLREVIHSGKEEILHLTDEKATGFTDALHKVKCLIDRLNDMTTLRSSLQHVDW